VNIAEIIRSINPFDLVIVLVLFAFFILGFMQGTIRRLLGIAAIIFSFILAANLRQPLGDFLKANWTQFPPDYAVMVGFGTVFVAAMVSSTLVIQSYYQKMPLFGKHPIIDELLGGALGIVQGALILGAAIIILDTWFTIPGQPARDNELPGLRAIYEAYDPPGAPISQTAVIYRDALVPGFLAVTGPVMPQALRAFYPGR
jgi:membrane protein required for colicin V production